MSHESHRAGGQDWLDTWRRMYDDERAQGEAATDALIATTPDFWEGQAERFAESAARAPQPDGFLRFVLPQLKSTDTVLDIGAGTGRYEPLLGQHVRQVLALEPSAAMRRHLAQRSGANVEIIAAGWPHAPAPTCDVAIAAHVLYGVREIGPFLTQMHAAAQRACYVLLAFRHPTSYTAPFWQAIHGSARLPLPGALECLSALYQLGLPANLSLVPIDRVLSFPSEDAALAEIRWRLRIAPEPTRDERLRSMIRELFEHTADGQLHPRGQANQAAVIWWERR